MEQTRKQAIADILRSMNTEQKSYFNVEYKSKKADLTTAYMLLIFTLHYVYMRQWAAQIIFWLTMGGLFIWWFIDLFRLPEAIRERNEDVAMQIIKDIKMMNFNERT